RMYGHSWVAKPHVSNPYSLRLPSFAFICASPMKSHYFIGVHLRLLNVKPWACFPKSAIRPAALFLPTLCSQYAFTGRIFQAERTRHAGKGGTSRMRSHLALLIAQRLNDPNFNVEMELRRIFV
ncbi:MAG: hypothetical protein WCA08_20195, partial [Desulfoferrobacter sp.]